MIITPARHGGNYVDRHQCQKFRASLGLELQVYLYCFYFITNTTKNDPNDGIRIQFLGPCMTSNILLTQSNLSPSKSKTCSKMEPGPTRSRTVPRKQDTLELFPASNNARTTSHVPSTRRSEAASNRSYPPRYYRHFTSTTTGQYRDLPVWKREEFGVVRSLTRSSTEAFALS